MQAETQNNLGGMAEPVEVPRFLYARRDAARALSVSIRKIDYLISDGRLKARRLDGRVLIHRDELARFAKGL